jgi:phospholipid/cholesterol/gamma-HCH transport system permease protein
MSALAQPSPADAQERPLSRDPTLLPPAAISLASPRELLLSGSWTVHRIGGIQSQFRTLTLPAGSELAIDCTQVVALDAAGAWVLQTILRRLQDAGSAPRISGLRPDLAKLQGVVGAYASLQAGGTPEAEGRSQGPLERLGRSAQAAGEQAVALLGFVGESSVALAGWVRHPTRVRWRPILHNIRSAGFDALPIVGLLSFLLGVVIAYQGADQLRNYGANIFVVDLVGLSMLREFAPLITAIIVAGRSGSAYAAQIGTMSVTEEIDAMRTIGIAPLEVLVLPKIAALLVALPLLTVFADLLGVLGGMIMARAQLGVDFREFLDRFVNAVSTRAYLVGIGKAPVFAVIIAAIGCFQGFRTKGGADSVGRHTTLSVVQSIFLVIVADALFSILFSALGL